MLKIDFSKIEELLNTSNTFSLTSEQYKILVGKDLPIDRYYLIHKSALANFAKKKGYKIEVHRDITIEFIKLNSYL